MRKRLSVLQVEDSDSDAALIRRMVERGGYEDLHWQRVENAADMRAALGGHPPDVIISDYNLPTFDAPAALRLLQESGQDIPFIVVSGAIGWLWR
jgi:CheY-like chemotaxis protein